MMVEPTEEMLTETRLHAEREAACNSLYHFVSFQ